MFRFLKTRRAESLILLAPFMSCVPAEFLQALEAGGADLVPSPLPAWAPPRAPEARDRARLGLADALAGSRGRRRVMVLAAQSLYGMGPLADLLPGGGRGVELMRIDCADLLRATLAALRAEIWLTGTDADGHPRSLPIPDEAAFRPDYDPRRIENMVLNIRNGRAALDLALGGTDCAQLIVDDAPDPRLLERLGIPDYRPAPPAPLADIAARPEALLELAASQAIPTRDLPPLAAPALHHGGPRLLALCCGRDVADHLPVLAARMHDEGVPLIYIDNGSRDDSASLAAELPGISAVHHLPFDGQFSVAAQLRLKAELAEAHAPQWVLNIDADEIIEHQSPGASLLDAASEADRHGYNAINFDEMVFLPEPGADYAGRDYLREMRRYYLHEPQAWRLMRMFRHGAGLTNIARGGHQLLGPLRLSPISHNLRHYIVLSQEAALRKYLGRSFASDEVAAGLHGNRLGLSAECLTLPPATDPRLKRDDGGALRREVAQTRHWWAWESIAGGIGAGQVGPSKSPQHR
ncbi:MAG: hypothetical protein Q4G36_00110 [Paracoccus sp. (in: a-proteobacteria)]|nr:hypothetical protein [Paracoccus sp. (in: a-proteobacteria)]